jgi:hypothetical protein
MKGKVVLFGLLCSVWVLSPDRQSPLVYRLLLRPS